ncbi:hypothetical protein THASP1DRAFT_29681 [Thamnocephalis sphaerospora]|uniref:FAS1 domain-containing protein n=1 Tax=Thamnocephalis sphaerospora TaxID=78915 RepID=A0A4P9XR35_9FUNG|nr:hypothetical protein THASP1DRAFT_29681 [Thamnocephalis sphaerospora]|eukprot:RKP08526.1 hypothetical protein THASP1DRAFT_29681 [Thamnocephalis sphaerospora]
MAPATGPTLNDLMPRDKTLTIFMDAYRQFVDLVQLLDEQDADITLIAPSNAAFQALAHVPTGNELRRRIQRHFVRGLRVACTQSQHGELQAETLASVPVTVTLQEGSVSALNGVPVSLSTKTPTATLYKVDVLLE